MTAPPGEAASYTAPQAARRLGLHPNTVYRLIAAGRLSAAKVGRCWRIPAAALDRYARDRAAAAGGDTPGAPPAAPPPGEAHDGALWEQAEDALYTLDLDGRLTDLNRQGERLTGYPREALLGRPITELIAPADHDAMHRQMARTLAGEPVTTDTLALRARDGRAVVAEVSSRLLRDAAGRPAGVQGIARDVTARVALEADLRASEERLRLAAEAVGFGTYDDQGPGRVYWSPELKALFGLHPDARPDEGPRDALALIHPDDRARWLAALEAARDPAGTGVMTVEHRVVRPGGEVIWVAQSGRILFAGEGTARRRVRALGIVADITTRKRAEAEREALLAREQAALAEARAALAVRDAFLASVTHDLRTPLTTIRGQAQLLARRLGRLDAPQAAGLLDQVAAIARAARAMAAMVDELLDLTRLEAGQQLELRRAATDLVALARGCVQGLGGARRHTIRVAAGAPALVGRWDAARLERVVGNLLANAVKYSPDGGEVVVTIRPAEAAGGAWAELAVADQGIGIPAADLPRVFARFHRGANVAGRIPGAGLGLAGARSIVEQHGGTIAITSAEGAGTTVVVRLPMGEPPAAPAPAEA